MRRERQRQFVGCGRQDAVGISERDHGRRKQNRFRTDMATGQRTPWCRKPGVFVLQLKEDCDVEIDDVVKSAPMNIASGKKARARRIEDAEGAESEEGVFG